MRWVGLLALAGCQLVFDVTPRDAIVIEPDGPLVPPKYLFATSQTYTGAIGGLLAADLECNRLATAASLDGTFLAWLSDGAMAPASRMTRSNGPYRLVGETPIANNWDDLVDGELANGIRLDELGNPAFESFACNNTTGAVWSNTLATGESAGSSCADWTSTTDTGTIGQSIQKTAKWTLSDVCGRLSCTSRNPIYCVQQ